MQLTLLYQTSRRQSLDHQEASAAAEARASQPSNDAGSAQAYPTAPFAPTAPGTSPYNNAGDSQARLSGRSDMSQALLFNTAALESNLAAAQQGDAVDLNEVEESESVGANVGTSQANIAAEPNRNGILPGAHHNSIPVQATCIVSLLNQNAGMLLMVACMQDLPHFPHKHISHYHPPNRLYNHSPSKSRPPQVAQRVVLIYSCFGLRSSADVHHPCKLDVWHFFAVEIPQAPAGFQPSLSAISEAQKQAKYAASSLGFEDVQSAIKQLTDALKLLTQPGTASVVKRR